MTMNKSYLNYSISKSNRNFITASYKLTPLNFRVTKRILSTLNHNDTTISILFFDNFKTFAPLIK